MTQSAPVCLICSNTSATQWSIVGGGTPTGVAGAPYILHVTTPTTTFLGGPQVNCYGSSAQSTRIKSSGE